MALRLTLVSWRTCPLQMDPMINFIELVNDSTSLTNCVWQYNRGYKGIPGAQSLYRRTRYEQQRWQSPQQTRTQKTSVSRGRYNCPGNVTPSVTFPVLRLRPAPVNGEGWDLLVVSGRSRLSLSRVQLPTCAQHCSWRFALIFGPANALVDATTGLLP